MIFRGKIIQRRQAALIAPAGRFGVGVTGSLPETGRF